MRFVGLGRAVLVAAIAAGCDDRSNPAAASPPTPTTPTVISLVISGPDAVLTGSAGNYSASAALSNGTTKKVTSTWSSSNEDLAIVDNAGRLDGRAHGAMTLTATGAGLSATKRVQVVNDYQGTWTGRFIVNGCNAPPGVCLAHEVDFFAFPIRLEILQSGGDLSEISADFVLPSFGQAGCLRGRVTSDGRLNLAGSAELRDSRDNVWGTFHVGAWDTMLSSRDVMTGHWAQRLSTFQPPSDEIMENELETMTRTRTSGARVCPP